MAELADAELVISSSWRHSFDVEKVREILVANGLPDGRFHADFACSLWAKRTKREAVRAWLHDHPQVYRWVTVEDDHWDDPRVVHCTLDDGLTMAIYRQACEVLEVADDLLGR